MPTSGLSLVGFIGDALEALNHLTIVCVPKQGAQPASLLTDWTTAKAKLGPPTPKAGYPSIKPIPLTHPHIQALLSSPWGGQITIALQGGAEFQMVEIEPLLAFQKIIDSERSQHHCNHLSNPPTEQELFSVCLPITLPQDDWKPSFSGQSMFIRSRSLNLRILRPGPLPIPGVPNVVGIQFGWQLPAVHVVRFNGRCYLHNGYHRALGCALAGATEVPCLFRDVHLPAQVPIAPPDTFAQAILESSDPPTLAHFIKKRALDVQLRIITRMIHVNWSEHAIADE